MNPNRLLHRTHRTPLARLRAALGPLSAPSLFALLVLGIAACSTPRGPAPKPIPRYVAPTEGPTARFLVRSQIAADELYGVYVLEQSETCSGHRIVGAGDAQRHPDATTLAAERLQTIEFRLVRPDKKVCAIRWSFTPETGKTYLLRALGMPTGCSAAVIDMTDADHMRPAAAVRRNSADKPCVPLALAKGPGAGASTATSEDAVLREGQGSDDLKGLIQP